MRKTLRAALLLGLSCLLLALAGTSLARYTARSAPWSDSGRAAALDFLVEGEVAEAVLAPGEGAEVYRFRLNNTAEVPLCFDLTLTLPADAARLDVTLDEKPGSAEDGRIIFRNVEQLAARTPGEQEHVLRLAVPEDQAESFSSELAVSVTGTQIG